MASSKVGRSLEMTTSKVASLVKQCEASIQQSLGPADTLERPLRKSSSSRKYNVSAYTDNGGVHSSKVRRQTQVRVQDKNDRCFHTLTGVLHCYNVFLLVLGSGVLGAGIWLLVKDFSSRELSSLFTSRFLEYISYFLTAGGGAVFVLAFCGCCGTMKKEKFVLAFYGGVLTLVLVLMIVGCTLGMIFRSKVEEKANITLLQIFHKHYGVDVTKNPDNRLITDAVDAMQRTLECCGAYGDELSWASWPIYFKYTKWGKRSNGLAYPYVPESCCVPGGDVFDCQGMENKYQGYPVYGPPLPQGMNRNPNLYKEGCFDKALEFVKSHALYMAIGCGSVPLFLIIGISISFYLCSVVENYEDDEDEDECTNV